MTVPLTSLYENGPLHKRLPGAHPIFSKEDDTILCNQLYLIHTKDKTSQSLGRTVKYVVVSVRIMNHHSCQHGMPIQRDCYKCGKKSETYTIRPFKDKI